jgi:hypothetical protein
MKRADAVPFTVAFAAAEHYVDRTQPGLTGDARAKAVLEKFHEATYRTQNGNSSTEISYMASRLRQSGPVLQALLMFQSDANKKLNQFARWGEMNKAQRTRLGCGDDRQRCRYSRHHLRVEERCYESGQRDQR